MWWRGSPAGEALEGPAQYGEALADAEVMDQASAPAVRHDSSFPTEEERATLRRVPEFVSPAAFAIGICELAERFSFYGATQVFSDFISNPRPHAPGNTRTGAGGSHVKSGALGHGSQVANGIVTFNQFWCYFTPLIGAYIADAYLGRFHTICVASIITLVGHVLLVIAALPGVLDSENGAMACFVIAVIVMGLGTGFFKSCCSVLVAEQMKVKELTVTTRKNGERVIVDPALTYERVYLWYYMMINIGMLTGDLGMIYSEEYVGYWLAYLLPTIVFLVPFPVLWFGRNYYVCTPPEGSIVPLAYRTWHYALRRSWHWGDGLRIFTKRTFWEPAKPSNVPVEQRPSWMTFHDLFVEELSRCCKVFAVFVLLPLYWLCYNQMTSNLIVQANMMNLHGGPAEIVAQLDPIFILVFVPVFNLGLYPLLERMRIPFTPIKRITVGFFFAALAMAWAAVVQQFIYTSQRCGSHVGTSGDCADVTSPVTVWAQAGSYGLIAISELFASVVSMEIAMLMAPRSMRSIVMAVGIFTTAVAAAIGEAFTPLATNPLYIINYVVFACLGFVGGVLFYLCFFRIDRKQEELNLLGQNGAGQAGAERRRASPDARTSEEDGCETEKRDNDAKAEVEVHNLA